MRWSAFIVGAVWIMSLSLPSAGEEFRGIWATTTFFDGASPQPSDYQQLMDNLQSYNFNSIFYYAALWGMANFPSSYFLWNEHLTGTMGQDPGWDPLGYAIQLAHARGIRLHAKINTYQLWSAGSLPDEPEHIANAHPEWILVGRDGNPMDNSADDLFLNPCHPEVKELIRNVCLEMALGYDIDGLHFDFIRFPSRNYSYDPVTLNRFWARFGKSPDSLPAEWDQWRRDQITELLLDIKNRVRRVKWDIEFSAAVWASRTSGIANFLQDMERWLEMGIMDFEVPMLYTTNLTTFESQLIDHLNHAHGRDIYSGVGVHQMGGNFTYLDQQMTVSRAQETSGVVIYKDPSLFPNHVPNAMADQLKANYFASATVPPSFPWKTKTESNPPTFSGLATAEPRNGMAVLRWEPASDVTLPLSYNVYVSTPVSAYDFNRPLLITQETHCLVEGLQNLHTYHFIVRAEDDFANEDTNTVQRIMVPQSSVSFMLEDFEAGTNAYWNGNHASGIIFRQPTYSGSTQGVDASSYLDVVTTPVLAGGYAGKLYIKWSDPVNGFCRVTTHPDRPLCPDYTGWLSVEIYGTGDRTRIAPVFHESGYEHLAYVTVDWTGWRRVEWFLPEEQFTGWGGGDGVLSGGVFGGEFEGLFVLPGDSDETLLYIDDLQNEIRPDVQPPEFAGLQDITSGIDSVHLSWSMAMDASNPITYHIYRALSPTGFNFAQPIGSTQQLEYTVGPLPIGQSFFFVVRAQDARGNQEHNLVVKSAASSGQEVLEDFEAGTTAYWNGDHENGIIFMDPNYSGSTHGLDDQSAWSIESSLVHGGNYSGKLYLKWTDMVDGFCRVTTHPNRPELTSLIGSLSAWVYGQNDNSQLALVLMDDLHPGGVYAEYEMTPYVTVNWTGWKRLEWRLPEIEWVGWAYGTGELENLNSGAHLEGFFFLPGDAAETTIYVDDVRFEREISLGVRLWYIY